MTVKELMEKLKVLVDLGLGQMDIEYVDTYAQNECSSVSDTCSVSQIRYADGIMRIE